MNKAVLNLGVAIATLLAASAFAQSDQPGETKAAPGYKPTPTEKAQANQERRAAGKSVARSNKTDADTLPNSVGTRKAASKSERRLAAAKRKAEGTSAARQRKDVTTGAGGDGGGSGGPGGQP